MYQTPSRTNSRGAERRPPAHMAPSLASMSPQMSASAGSLAHNYSQSSHGGTLLSTPHTTSTWAAPSHPAVMSPGSPTLSLGPQTPQQRLMLRKPMSMQTLSTVRSSSRLNASRNSFGATTGEVYKGKIHVCVRSRPSSNGTTGGAWYVDSALNMIDHESAGEFQFDKVYDSAARNYNVFEDSVAPLVQQVVNGFNATVFAYGTTGSGKTWTMQGAPQDIGVIPRSVRKLFDLLNEANSPQVKLSYFEIYNERVFDLLSGGAKPLEVKLRDGSSGITGSDTKVVGQREVDVHTAEELLQFVAQGDQFRRTYATQYNEHSSRSHAIVRIHLRNNSAQSVLYLCDLAGSERAVLDSERRLEGSYINKSLLTLSTVISILSQGGSGHVPYRDSKLTRLLQPSLSGTALVAVLCTVQLGPPPVGGAETLNSIRFAARAKNIVVTAKRNSIFDDAFGMNSPANAATTRIVEQLQSECEHWKREVEKIRAERDDLQDKLSLLQSADDVNLENSLEAMTGVSFTDENTENSSVALRKKLQDSQKEIEALRSQNRHLLAEYDELNNVVSKLESNSSPSSDSLPLAYSAPASSGTSPSQSSNSSIFSSDTVSREEIQELKEQLKDRDQMIAFLSMIRDEQRKIEQLEIPNNGNIALSTADTIQDLHI